MYILSGIIPKTTVIWGEQLCLSKIYIYISIYLVSVCDFFRLYICLTTDHEVAGSKKNKLN